MQCISVCTAVVALGIQSSFGSRSDTSNGKTDIFSQLSDSHSARWKALTKTLKQNLLENLTMWHFGIIAVVSVA
jgi:hypothetical protein